jgi:mono/diheme cytochrome c family protein/small nuclear ribonucleoprotein (snRNP)-like protein
MLLPRLQKAILLTTLLPWLSLAGQTPAVPKPNPQDVERLQKFLAIGKAPDPAAVERGKAKFIATCSFCHGTNANGGQGGPDLIRSTLVLHDNNGDNIGPVILHGRMDKGMPAFASTTPAQISDIAAFLKSRYQLAANRGSYQILNLVTGDAKVGEAYFNGEGGCSGCHSATGDLAGIGTRLTPDRLQAAFLYPKPRRAANPEAYNRARETVIVTLPSGKVYSGVLNQLDDFSVTLTDAAAAKHTFPLAEGDSTKVEVHDPLAGHLELLKKYSNADMHNVLAYLVTLK